ncbi:protein tyrosine phosphatase domain-containing protein 1-like [Arapaima gigas]
MTLPVPVPRPSYSQAREHLVKAIPPKIICLLACGGRDCRYEDPSCWRPSQQAIKGIFSTWMTEDIVAMARPSTWLMQRYNIIEQFHKLNIKSIINMQLPWEHSYCGPPLDPASGFSYSPQAFMENEIFFYNFGMPDFGVSSLASVLDGVKVLSFAVKEGKVAVHCHAGLGRTGVLIACYLVYELRVSPSEAVHYVRVKRPRSVQTRDQINMVFSFARLLATQLVLYPTLAHRHGAPFSLQQHLRRQALLLHGEEARRLKSVPKVVHFLCRRLAALARGHASFQAAGAELRKRAAVLDLTKAVRDTLTVKKFLPVLRDAGARKDSGSLPPSWDEPRGFLERKREALLNKRSYSDSDLSKIALFEVRNQARPHPSVKFTQLDSNVTADDPKGARQAAPSSDCGSTGGSKRTKCTSRKTVTVSKFSSNIELRTDQNCCGLLSVSQAVARAMAEEEPPGEETLQRAAALQEELNGSECGWATLALESDPAVLSCLLWTWLEKLKEPVLSAEDVELLSSSSQAVNGFGVLNKARHLNTITRLLACVSQVTALCPSLEDAVLLRLLRALTRCSQHEGMACGLLLNLFKQEARQMRWQQELRRAVGTVTRRPNISVKLQRL